MVKCCRYSVVHISAVTLSDLKFIVIMAEQIHGSDITFEDWTSNAVSQINF